MAAACLIGAPSLQAMPACTYQNILTELDGLDRDYLEETLRKALEIKNSEAVFWRIEKAGRPTSYLFGTVHVADRQLQALTPEVRTALDATRTLAMESSTPTRAANRIAAPQAARLMTAHDKPLQRILTDDELKVVERAVSVAGYPESMALAFQPWAATLLLADSPCQKAKRERGYKTIDEIIHERALRHGKKIVGMESMLEQLQSIAGIDKEAQHAWLKAAIETHDRVDGMANAMAELYVFRRIGILWELMLPLAPHSGLTTDIIRRMRTHLIDERNQRMMMRLEPHLDDGGVFIAVGALHLSGDHGMVELIRAKGFDVTAIQ